MKEGIKTKEQLLKELAKLRKCVEKLRTIESDHKRTVEALRVSKDRFEMLAAASFEGINLAENGVIIDLNDQIAKMHEYDRNELLGKQITKIIAPESREQFDQVMRLGEQEPVELLDLRKDGTKFPVEVCVKNVRIGGRELVLTTLRDITKRKQFEETLRYERNLLRIFIENLPDLFCVKDVQGRYILNNPAHLRSIGVDRQENVLGKTAFDFHSQELAAQYFADDMKVVQSGVAMIDKEEIHYHHDTGRMHWHLTSKIPLKDEEGIISGIVCISHDITEQKRVQEAFQRERNFLRTLIENIPDIIYFKDKEGHYVLNNRAHLSSIGAGNQEDVLGKTTFDFHPPDFAKKYNEDDMEVIRSGKGILKKEEIALHRDTGKEHWHLSSKIPLVDGQGNVAGIVGISRDITDQKYYEEALQHERHLLRTLIDNLPDLIYLKDIEGRYILDNLPHMLTLGVKRQEDIIGKTVFDFHPAHLAKLYAEDERNVVRTGKALVEREELAMHKDKGEQRWHLTTRVPLVDNRGKVTGLVGIARDITGRKHAEAERERLIKELQEALADIKTLSGLVPICASCKKIRDDKGYWTQVESYIQERSQARFSHGICPECMKKLYPEFLPKKNNGESSPQTGK